MILPVLLLLGVIVPVRAQQPDTTTATSSVEELSAEIAALKAKTSTWDKVLAALPEISGYVQTGYEWSDRSSTFFIKRVRLNLAGAIAPKLDYRVQIEFASPKIVDAYLCYKPFDELNVQLGEYKLPFSIENTDYVPLRYEFVEYPLSLCKLMGFSDLCGLSATGRDLGAQLFGGFFKRDGYSILNYNFGVFNGEGLNVKDKNKSKDIVARLTVKPVAGLQFAGSYYWGEYGEDYLKRPEADRHAAMARFGLDRNIPKMQSDLRRYGIEYDQWFFESELHESGYVAESVQKLTDLGFTYEKDGALWLRTSEILGSKLRAEGKTEEEIAKLDLKDDVLRRANGFYTYFAADIAYHRNKFEKRGFDKVINVWGADHHGHVARLKGAMDALGLDGEHRLDIVLMQLVKLTRNGEVVRMSKRTGKAISLTDLLDEIPVDAARYFFNSRPESPVEFDLELAIRQDSENPVYYVQYAHARICSMLAALAADGHSVPAAADADLSLLDTDAERELIKQLAALPEEIRLAARDYDPSRINKYVTELAARFHRFYTVCRIKGAETGVLEARLLLADTVRRVLAVALGIIGVSAPEKM